MSRASLIIGIFWASQVGSVVRNQPANVGDKEDSGLILGLGRSPGAGNDNPLQYFGLVNPQAKRNIVGYSTGVAKTQA